MFFKKLSRDVGFFELFTRHAAGTLDATRCLFKALETWPESSGQIRRIQEIEHECDGFTHQVVDMLHSTFITPLDRDEIVKLISRLDDIVDATEVTARRMLLFEIKTVPAKLRALAEVLTRAAETVSIVVEKTNGFKNIDKIREHALEVHRLENEADGLFQAGLAELFKESAHDPLNVIKLKEIYETVERAVDRCEDVVNVIEGIALEHN